MSDIATAPRAGTAQIRGTCGVHEPVTTPKSWRDSSARYTRARSGGPNLLVRARASMLDAVPV